MVSFFSILDVSMSDVGDTGEVIGIAAGQSVFCAAAQGDWRQGRGIFVGIKMTDRKPVIQQCGGSGDARFGAFTAHHYSDQRDVVAGGGGA